MKTRKLGQTDLEASAIGLGTWAIGGGPWWGAADEAESIRTIHAAIDQGITLMDTAPAYGLGRSESVLGRALKGRRNEVVLATKCGIWWQDQRNEVAFEVEGVTAYKSLAPDTIRKELEMSLKRLDTDYIDLYQTHWPVTEAGVYEIEDTMACLVALRDEGVIRAIGASNVSLKQVERYQAVGVLDAVQPKYSMLDRAIEETLLPHLLEASISTLVYSPLEQGLLTGRFGMSYAVEQNTARAGIPWFEPKNRQRVLAMLEGWRDLTQTYECTLGQLVIAWTIAQKGVTYALCGARKVEHVLANATAGRITLSDEHVARMRADAVNLTGLVASS